ncbi:MULTISPECIES: alkaline shock response membrane anchor protein AmaP [Vagococcus]|uniref:alkaline shock response membrane anchor protein AmaP n=1 Tax=Vagococcus TaxID=2737 RepID=UPI001A8CBDC7|nr:MULTISPECIES: alkaline shock response membrane anchor protein AmaP [Vagococcus]MBO0444621.1 alkaline shock response membrane anchor protein AmaP [Vagococcus fluvialis]MDT2832156.1 alkaline shock response membrane anchor protein AmaP [Vagococcus carniphilus]MDT2855601.1 alkaline shock response membrane anchor protein AmaP [Vagococcus carniphilus]WNF91543.1 alkaline shock response membrane anchor protein AmaP [Vagococcus fluvialis]
MYRYKKVFILISILLLIPLLFTNVIQNQYLANFSFELIKMENYPFVGSYIPFYLFWGSILVIIFLIILFFFILLYPRNKTEIYFSKSKGTLSIKKNAVEQFVSTILTQEPWLKNPKVSVTMKKKKIKIFISCNCSNINSNLVDKTSELSHRIRQEFSIFLGIDDPKQISVEIKQVSNKKTSNPRVI